MVKLNCLSNPLTFPKFFKVDPMTDLRHSYLQGMSFAAATVNIVTSDGNAGQSGVTVSEMSRHNAKPLVAIPINANIFPIDIAMVHRANTKLSKTAQTFVQQFETFFQIQMERICGEQKTG